MFNSMLVVALLVLGFGGIVAQTLLLREMLILFSGNELSLCLIIGSWILSEALGAFAGGIWAERKVVNSKNYTWATLLFSAAFPASIYATRVFKALAGIPPETTVAVTTVFYASFVLLLPTGFLHGFLFSLACALYAGRGAMAGSPAAKVYLYETLGTIAGGLAASFLLIPHLHAFQIGFGLVLLNGICSLLLLRCARPRKATFTYALTGALFVALPILVIVRGADSLHVNSVNKVFGGKNLVDYENSSYQNIAVVKTEDQYTFFTDGLPAVTTPVPDIASVEEYVHFSLPAHPFPEMILFLGGGAGGAIREALKYPSVKQIDYVELDPAMLQAIRRFPTPLTERELTDPRVHLHFVDGRKFIRETSFRYDVVLLYASSPSTLQKNRLFTEESFTLAKRILRDKGVLSFTLPGSLTYYSPELKAVNVSVLRSLSAVFAHQYVVPGDTNIVLASASADITSLTAQLLYKRIKAAQVPTNLITYEHLADRLQERHRDWFRATVADVEVLSNRDFRPSAVFYQVAYENLMLAPSLKPVFAWTQRVTMRRAASIVMLFFCVLLIVGYRSARASLSFAVASTGFAGMAVELMLIFCFQVMYGYVFYEIALLITAFMAGIAAGSLLVTGRLMHVRRAFSFLLSSEVGFILFMLLLMALLMAPFYRLGAPVLFGAFVVHLLFFILLFVSGIFTGVEFPLATSIYQPACSLGRSVGMLYAADLVGGYAGGLCVGFLLFPLMGLFSTCSFLLLIKLCSLVFLLVQRKRVIMT